MIQRFFYAGLFLILGIGVAAGQKQVYVPTFITDQNMDLNDPASQWAYERSKETDNIVLFWEPGFGADPSTNPSPYTVDIDAVLEEAELAYDYFIDSLGFAVRGNSVTDQYKLMVFLLYTTDWAAFGSGQDDLVGSLFVSPAAANINDVLAHEIGHCFQYITGCDTEGGFRYGFGPNGEGGNGFWEQCAQWMAFKLYPERIMDEAVGFANLSHLHIVHENTRYQNYFITEYWSHKQGLDFIGQLWTDAEYLEDPIQAYQRLTGIDQEAFNDEIYEYAARLTTWDLPDLYPYSDAFITAGPQSELVPRDEEYWMSEVSESIENYGFNAIRLNAPQEETLIAVELQGLVNEPGFRAINPALGGWRFGFVALLEDGTRVYSDAGTSKVAQGSASAETVSFLCPDDCEKLWLVVSGAPQAHWKHEWDDDPSNDEQWPYKVKFSNVELFRIQDLSLVYDVVMEPRADYEATLVPLDKDKITDAFGLSTQDIAANLGSAITYAAIEPDGVFNPNATANYPGHWFDANGQTVNWGEEAFVYSELDINALAMNIGQYPDRAMHGDSLQIRQALTYQKSGTESATIDITFNIKIVDEIVSSTAIDASPSVYVFPNPCRDVLHISSDSDWVLFDKTGRRLADGKGSVIRFEGFSPGMYIVKAGEQRIKVVKIR